MRLVICAGLILLSLLFVSVEPKVSVQSSKELYRTVQESSIAPPLTEAEERDLVKLVNQTLAWIMIWMPEPHECLEGDTLIPLNLPEIYKRLEDQEHEMKLVIGRETIALYFAAMHVRIEFSRASHFGLNVIDTSFSCAATNDEMIVEENRLAEKWRAYEERDDVRKRKAKSRADPYLGLFFEQFNKDNTSTHEVLRQQVLKYVPNLKREQPEQFSSWNTEKLTLYEQMLSIVQDEWCRSGEILSVTIPDFQIGDPGVYLLVQGESRDDALIEWIALNRDTGTGKYYPVHVKGIILPREGQNDLRSTIKKRQVKQLKITCP